MGGLHSGNNSFVQQEPPVSEIRRFFAAASKDIRSVHPFASAIENDCKQKDFATVHNAT